MGSREKMTDYLLKRESLKSDQSANTVCRDRIRSLLDEDSFVELDSLVLSRGLSFGFEREKVAGDGVVTGYGTIDGRLVYVAAQDPAVHGGSLGQMHAAKISKAISLAASAKAPFIGLYDSGGSRIEEGIVALEGLGDVLASLNSVSGEIPLIAAVMGPCAGGLALAAAASDFVLMSEKGSAIFMNGPMVVSAVEGKSVDVAGIGGSKVHAVKTGLASFVSPDEKALLDQVKTLLAYLPDSSEGFAFAADATDDPNRTESRLDEIAVSLDNGCNMNEIISLVVDQGTFLPVSSAYAPGMITGLALMGGITVGVIGNADRRMDSAMARKAERFVAFCDRFSIPLITFTDAEGFAIGIVHESGDLIASTASLMQAFLNTSVPRIGIVVGKAFGTAYLLMNSKSTGADLVYAWPTAEIAVMGSDAAAHIVYRKEIAASDDPSAARRAFADKYADEIASPTIAASLGHIDEVIQPSATRPRLISALDMLIAAY